MDPQVNQPIYIPSTLEKKKAVMCILFMGILMSLVNQKSLSPYTYYYLSVSIGRRSIGLLIIILVILSLLVTLFLFFSLPLFIVRLSFGVFLIHQAWNWSYNHNYPILRFFAGLGSWLLSLFDTQNSD
jgi:hypothetical protein